MVTMNGEECHNEWEITFEEMKWSHRFAIYNYHRYTGDYSYIPEKIRGLIGCAVLASKSNFSAQNQYVILGVTGPNEYENNVNNFTPLYCKMVFRIYSIKFKSILEYPSDHKRITEKKDYRYRTMEKKYLMPCFPFSEEYNVYLQQDGFLDKNWCASPI
jgi:maltose phosphorylase